MADMFEPTLPEIIIELNREILMRERVYGDMVRKGRMKQDDMDRRIRNIVAARDRLLKTAPLREAVEQGLLKGVAAANQRMDDGDLHRIVDAILEEIAP